MSRVSRRAPRSITPLTVVSLLGWILFRRAFQDDSEETARFATRFFLVMTVLEVIVFVGVIYAVYRLVATGQG